LDRFDAGYVRRALETCRGKVREFSELPAYGGFYFTDEVIFDAEADGSVLIPDNRELLQKLRETFAVTDPFDAGTLERALKQTAAGLGVKPRALVHPCRVACTGATAGPSLYHLLEVLGKERVLRRLDRALERI
jgi:glutamyl-tRNA synthetase